MKSGFYAEARLLVHTVLRDLHQFFMRDFREGLGDLIRGVVSET